MYVIFLKDNVAVSKAQRTTVDRMNISPYDNCIEISKNVFDTIELPARLVNGEWRKTDCMPCIDYPIIESMQEVPTEQEDIDAMLIDHEYRLTMLELGVNE